MLKVKGVGLRREEIEEEGERREREREKERRRRRRGRPTPHKQDLHVGKSPAMAGYTFCYLGYIARTKCTHTKKTPLVSLSQCNETLRLGHPFMAKPCCL